jgi:L-Ala-D/L-Glu epimerase
MRIRRFIAYIVRLPLRRPFTHATAARQESENVFIRCELVGGTTGWGEGVPRSYVTGETPAGCLEQLATTPLADVLAADCSSWPDVIRLCEGLQLATIGDNPRGCYGNALRCAIELSILDAFARLFGQPVREVTRLYRPAEAIRDPSSAVQYGAVIDSSSSHLRRSALVRRLYGFRDCKVKVGRQGDDDAARLRTIRRWIGRRVDLRIDVNGAWRSADVRARLEPLLASRISCVEQPVAHDEVALLAALRGRIGVPIMLDESLTSEIDARSAIEQSACDLFNIRLSKCGGFLASLRLAALARSAGLGYQLGCHPGESGILSAAGRHWASSVANIRYLEGSYDRHLFRRQVTRPDITFGYGGLAPALAEPGLGVTIDTAVLEDFATAERTFSLA